MILWLALAALPLLMLAWAAGIEPALTRIRRVTLDSLYWPPERGPLRVVLIADIHAGAPHVGAGRLDRLVAAANAEMPDLVLLGGDYLSHVLGGRAMAPDEVARRLGGLKGRLGVFAVLGNRDRRRGMDGPVRQALERAGIVVLENEARHIRFGRSGLWIVGIGYQGRGRGDVARAMGGVPLGLDGGDPVLVLTHDPGLFDAVPRGVAAILAAHTHGGQARVPLLGAVFNNSRAPLSHSRGVVDEDEKIMYVTAGIGTSLLPLRFNCPPEIAVLTIRTEPLQD